TTGGAFNNGGILSLPAGSTLTAAGYTQTATAALDLTVGELTGQFNISSLLQVLGPATLDGTLNLTLDVAPVNGEVPRLGDGFKIVTYTSNTGQFATINGLALGNGLVFQPNYNPTDLTLTVVNG